MSESESFTLPGTSQIVRAPSRRSYVDAAVSPGEEVRIPAEQLLALTGRDPAEWTLGEVRLRTAGDVAVTLIHRKKRSEL